MLIKGLRYVKADDLALRPAFLAACLIGHLRQAWAPR
jgi:hypothetical protein